MDVRLCSCGLNTSAVTAVIESRHEALTSRDTLTRHQVRAESLAEDHHEV